MQDLEILDKIHLNDHAAFDLLIEKYQGLVYSTCFRLLKTQADSEDLTQEVFMEIFRSIVHLKNVEDMSGWIYRISYCKCISFLRKKNPAKSASHADPGDVIKSLDRRPGHSNRETPLKTLEKKEASIVLFEKIDQLPEKQKRAILLHKFEGYSHKEICEKMELSQASVESLIYRAKVSLRKSLVSYFENQ
jgi:RNA polymerase sigma-70 factor (ECF subfamily)